MRAVAWAVVAMCLAAANAAAAPWHITKDHWTAADEAGFGQFVAAIGESNCSSTESCLRDPANPYRASDKHFVDIDVDCAKWAYLLRGYYAWKNGLPFSYVNAVSGGGADLRYSRRGNRPVSRHDVIDSGQGIDGPRELRAMLGAVWSATYRTDASQVGGVLSDFYSPAIQPGSIRPGTLIYDVNGHVGIVYKVDADGRIYYMDAHPDFTVTRSVYGAQFGQSSVQLGGGLKDWRPFRLVGAHRDAAGNLIGGHMAFAPNDRIADFSLVQYTGTEPNPARDVRQARFAYNGAKLGFYEYVRVAVSGGKTSYNPVYELQVTMQTLCNDLNDRAQYVNLAISDGIADKSHPAHLPDNIYGSDDGTWESYSTPSRDDRIRAAFAQFYRDMDQMIGLWVHRDPRIVYDGNFLKRDLLAAYDKQSRACTITYLNSAKKPVAMTFDDMAHRLYAMSFDPYDCIELRWGAMGAERESCTDGRAKLKWYAAEQKLRDRTGRAGDTPPPVDVRALIENMPDQVSFQGMAPVGR